MSTSSSSAPAAAPSWPMRCAPHAGCRPSARRSTCIWWSRAKSLRQEQRARLADACPTWHPTSRPTWHARFETVPPGPLLVVANEFFDALPIRQFERVGGGWRERVVALAPESDALRFAATGTSCAGTAGPGHTLAPAGAIVERAPARDALAAALAARVAADGGAALIVDYGHERPGIGDTLQALRRHRRHDVLDDPGSADLSAHVDFCSLAAAARREGARTFGPVSQGAFLRTLGIGERAAALGQGAGAAEARTIDAALRRLTGAHAMGALFKALAIAHPALDAPPGFAAAPGVASP